jgi:hypothetical protein
VIRQHLKAKVLLALVSLLLAAARSPPASRSARTSSAATRT